jgi:hypothetical protein
VWGSVKAPLERHVVILQNLGRESLAGSREIEALIGKRFAGRLNFSKG